MSQYICNKCSMLFSSQEESFQHLIEYHGDMASDEDGFSSAIAEDSGEEFPPDDNVHRYPPHPRGGRGWEHADDWGNLDWCDK